MQVKVVIDTNVYVPSLFYKTHIYHFLYAGTLKLMWNNFTRNEAHEIIDRLWPILSYKSELNLTKIHKDCDLLLEQDNYITEMPTRWPPQSMDRDDDNFLWVAFAGQTEYLITKDDHLLSLIKFRSIPIGDPHQFFKWAKKNKPIA